MVDPMLAATKKILAYVRDKLVPKGPNPMAQSLIPWEADLRGQEKGGSGNHGKLAWLLEYIRDNPDARTYFLDLLRWQLSKGLMAHEQMTVTYGGLHLGCVTILWHLAWYRGDEELCRLAGAWLERVLLLECLCGRREGDRIRLLSPGMRADVDSVTKGRKVEGAIVGRLLGIPQTLRLDHDDWWGPLWDCIRELEGVGLVAGRVRHVCGQWLHEKSYPPPALGRTPAILRRIRLMVPMTFLWWPNGDWFAWLPRSTHGQDPPCMGSGWIGGEHVFLWPWEDGSDPPEEGWRAEAKAVVSHRLSDDAWSRRVEASWYRKGHLVKEDWINLPPGPPPEIIGARGGPDPLKDLPPAPPQSQHPWRQGGRPGPGVSQPRPRKPVDVPWDLRLLKETLEAIRDNDRARWKRLAVHRALATLDRLGAWEGLEEEGGNG